MHSTRFTHMIFKALLALSIACGAVAQPADWVPLINGAHMLFSPDGDSKLAANQVWHCLCVHVRLVLRAINRRLLADSATIELMLSVIKFSWYVTGNF